MPTHPQSGANRIAGLFLALALGPALMLVAMPDLFGRFPSNLSRVGRGLRALESAEFDASVAVLGNSVSMAGIDGAALVESLPGPPGVIHLGSTGQSLANSYLLYRALPASVQTVVLLLSAASGTPAPLTKQQFNNLYMFGLRPDPATIGLLTRAYGEALGAILRTCDTAQRFEARWVLQQYPDLLGRFWFRPKLEGVTVRAVELVFPVLFLGTLPPKSLDAQLDRAVAKLVAGRLRIQPADQLLLSQWLSEAAIAHRRMVVALAPIHPRIRDRLREGSLAELQAALAATAGANADTLDLSTLLVAQEFYDAVHPNRDGARRLTRELARLLGRAR